MAWAIFFVVLTGILLVYLFGTLTWLSAFMVVLIVLAPFFIFEMAKFALLFTRFSPISRRLEKRAKRRITRLAWKQRGSTRGIEATLMEVGPGDRDFGLGELRGRQEVSLDESNLEKFPDIVHERLFFICTSADIEGWRVARGRGFRVMTFDLRDVESLTTVGGYSFTATSPFSGVEIKFRTEWFLRFRVYETADAATFVDEVMAIRARLIPDA
ncbi:hypothetical protein ITP53_06695 [Nonomuraea sp. K274]|uniref:Uncharacterized protein n=1 Tax=Nonomuraea cypriaca TaxID=1187855 RepID=A0A931A5L7_9ACTN|nr:hypothetical protein [Nonomuraea cypriaca]MBF8185430.1 hypothetical protein [Nonomuraea cypriaca]